MDNSTVSPGRYSVRSAARASGERSAPEAEIMNNKIIEAETQFAGRVGRSGKHTVLALHLGRHFRITVTNSEEQHQEVLEFSTPLRRYLCLAIVEPIISRSRPNGLHDLKLRQTWKLDRSMQLLRREMASSSQRRWGKSHIALRQTTRCGAIPRKVAGCYDEAAPALMFTMPPRSCR